MEKIECKGSDKMRIKKSDCAFFCEDLEFGVGDLIRSWQK